MQAAAPFDNRYQNPPMFMFDLVIPLLGMYSKEITGAVSGYYNKL
jgi:hypothetical protein